MQLTDQMKAEIGIISRYINGLDRARSSIRSEIMSGKLAATSKKYIIEKAKQLSTFKVRLENLLCETDLKERDH